MLNYRACFDETGTHFNSSFVVVAGYVARAYDWRDLERKWRKALKGVPYYHTTDIEANPPRRIYQGWSRKKADALTDRVVRVAAKFRGRPVGVHVRTKLWTDAIAVLLSKLPPNQPHSVPFQMLAKECMSEVIESLPDDLAAEEKVAFVFEENDFSTATLEGYRDLKRIHPKSSRFGAIAFESKTFPSLQIADLLAWHYRRTKEIQFGMRHHPVHRATTKLINSQKRPILREITKEYLDELIERAIQIGVADALAAALRSLFEH
jgi:hypothetical protein